ncbi:MAG TPA: acetoacetate decarboxylase family protein [Nocardioidaceae bacterium]|nr:acetoacetate decarboxylase family protein [Nocardioidaceae bacterium]
MTKKQQASLRPELAVAGVPETFISDTLLARLPENLAPAPWDARCTAVIWTARGGKDAAAALPPSLRRHTSVMVVGGLVRYEYTPVGTYDEVFGIVIAREGRKPFGTVAFMAVNGLETLVGGRTNWAMPKTLADFSGAPETGMTATGVESTWQVSARPRVIGPSIPYRTKGTSRQVDAADRTLVSALEGRFRMRPALVTVDVSSEGTLPRWLRPGRHLGAVSPEMSFSLGVPAVL